MWSIENRHPDNRDRLRHPSDVTEYEWLLIAPLIPPAKRGGRRRSVDLREVVNGVIYVLSTKCPWRHMPADLPPAGTLFGYIDLWTYQGVIERIHHTLFIDLPKIDEQDKNHHARSLEKMNS